MKNYADIPFAPSKFRVFYGWVILIFGTLGVLFSIPGQTMGISVFTDYLINELKLSRDALSTAYMLGTICSSFLLTYAGIMYDRFGARIVAIGATLLLSTSILFASHSPSISSVMAKVVNVPFAIITFIIITLAFFLIRFSGQGVLTLVSRNMMMKWFDKKRGRANAISSVFVSLGFAISPLLFSKLIHAFEWSTAWQIIALGILLFSILIYFFFRDNPEECGLIPDGKKLNLNTNTSVNKKQFTLKEATKTWGFWVFTFALSFYSFFGTGFTFNIVSIFKSFNYTEAQGLAIFIPISFVSVSISILGNYLSDFIKLQYLLFAMVIGAFLSTVGLVNLGSTWGYYTLICGFGIMGGLFVVLVSVTWPRFYGRKHLGAISGFSSSALVFSSAVGPLFFSRILTTTGDYKLAGTISLILVFILFIASFKAKNPQ